MPCCLRDISRWVSGLTCDPKLGVSDLALQRGKITLGGEFTRLYRAVSDAELEDILRFGIRPGAGTMETKLFTTSAEDAAFFAQNILFPLDQKPLTIVEVEFPDSLASRLFHFTTDGKTTMAVERNLLSEFNAAAGIQPLHFAPMPAS